MEGVVNEIEVMVEDFENVDFLMLDLLCVVGDCVFLWIWWDILGGFLRVLEIEDNVMFIIFLIFVLIVVMNIVLGLIMLVKNKGSDIGILCMMGLFEGLVLCVFFICGVFMGVIGILMGVVLGCFFVIYIDGIFFFVNYIVGGGVWDFVVCGIYYLFVELWFEDVFRVVFLSFGLFFVVIIFLVCCVVWMNLVEVLWYE